MVNTEAMAWASRNGDTTPLHHKRQQFTSEVADVLLLDMKARDSASVAESAQESKCGHSLVRSEEVTARRERRRLC